MTYYKGGGAALSRTASWQVTATVGGQAAFSQAVVWPTTVQTAGRFASGIGRTQWAGFLDMGAIVAKAMIQVANRALADKVKIFTLDELFGLAAADG